MPPATGDIIDPDLTQPAVSSARTRAWACVGVAALAAMVGREFPQITPIGWAIGAALLAGVSLVLPRRALGRGLLLVVFMLAGAWFTLTTTTVPNDSLDMLTGGNSRTLVAVHGVVRTTPAAPPPLRDTLGSFRRSSSTLGFDLGVRSVELETGTLVPASGRVRVRMSMPGRGPALDLVPGDEVRVMGWHQPPRGRDNPGDPDRLRWARMTGSAGLLSVTSPELITRHSARRDPGSALTRWVSAVRLRTLSIIAGDGSYPQGRAILAALLLGERDPALQESRSAFARTGTAHLLAISGFHLLILVGLAMMLIRLTGDHGRLESILLASLVVALLVLVPARVPIVRAGVMVLILLVGDALGRRYDRLTMLGWIALGLFIWRPMDVFSLGAQLSVGITALLIWVSVTRHPWIMPMKIRGLRHTGKPRRRRLIESVRGSFAVCVLAWIVALPVVAFHTGVVSMSGAVTTLVVTPIVVLLLGGGYLTLALSAVAPAPAAFLFTILAAIANFFGWVIATVADIPWASFELVPPSLLWTLAAVTTTLVYLRRAKPLAPGPIFAAMILTSWLVVTSSFPRALPPGVALRLDTLSVGDGTCTIIRSGTDAMLWDCGSLHKDLRPTLKRARAALGLTRVPTAFVTHANLDHYVSMPDATDLLGIETLFVSAHLLTDPAASVQALLSEMDARGVAVEAISAGFEMDLGHAHIKVLWPTPDADEFDDNDRSLIARITVTTDAGPRHLLLVGDIESAAMEALLETPERIRADILEAPHHGSYHKTSQGFVAAVRPSVMVQSTGWSRANDHRWDGQRARSHWLSTTTDGAVTVLIMRDGSIHTRTTR
jgi:competence protein ComEC